MNDEGAVAAVESEIPIEATEFLTIDRSGHALRRDSHTLSHTTGVLYYITLLVLHYYITHS